MQDTLIKRSVFCSPY